MTASRKNRYAIGYVASIQCYSLQTVMQKKHEELLGVIKRLEAELAAQKAAPAPKAAEAKEVQGNLLLNLGTGSYAVLTLPLSV